VVKLIDMKTTLIYFVSILARILNLALWGYVILSWFANASDALYKIYSFLGEIIEPILKPFRKLLYPITMKIGLDFSPYLLALAISFVTTYLLRLIYRL